MRVPATAKVSVTASANTWAFDKMDGSGSPHGEASALSSLIGQEAPVDIRGAVMGLFNLCGSIGILCITLVAGYIFDAWMPGGAFIFVGCINLAVFATAVIVRQKVGYRDPRGA